MDQELHPSVKIANLITIFNLAVGGILSGCTKPRSTQENILIAPNLPSATLEIAPTQSPPQPTPTQTQLPSVPEITSTIILPSPTLEPSPTVTEKPIPAYEQSRQQITEIMQNYGRVDSKYLTDQYWDRLQTNLKEQGPAERILTLEYHGDDYNMIDGTYTMTPQQFEKQMRYLMENNYHFVTGPELLMYVMGQMDLPNKSVILTTDSGNTSYKSLPRMTELFSKLEKEFGYPPHMQSFIWTKNMDIGETVLCSPDQNHPTRCWDSFRQALNSGYFTFGTHSESHRPFADLSPDQAKNDLSQSIQEIRNALGITVYSITWPHESCSVHDETLKDLGIQLGFGGRSRPILENFTYKNDNSPLCLPRNFPPNDNGVSSRPNGYTFENMLTLATTPPSP